MGLASSFLNWPHPTVERIAGALAFGGQRIPGLVGFAVFLAVAYMIYRVALKAPPAVDASVAR